MGYALRRSTITRALPTTPRSTALRCLTSTCGAGTTRWRSRSPDLARRIRCVLVSRGPGDDAALGLLRGSLRLAGTRAAPALARDRPSLGTFLVDIASPQLAASAAGSPSPSRPCRRREQTIEAVPARIGPPIAALPESNRLTLFGRNLTIGRRRRLFLDNGAGGSGSRG